MMGVARIYDRDGKLLDATPYFGGDAPITFGKAEREYSVAQATLSCPGLPELTIWRAPGTTTRGAIRVARDVVAGVIFRDGTPHLPPSAVEPAS